MSNTIILTIHNKEKTVIKIIDSLLRNTSEITSKIIIILDGCTDNSLEEISNFLQFSNPKFEIQIIMTEDLWETKANNVGLRSVRTKFATIVQDDMLIKQKDWDKRLISYFSKYELFAVSGRAAHDFRFENNKFEVVNLFGREYPFSSKNIFGRIISKLIIKLKPYWIYKYISFFSTRLVVNRGPLILDMEKAKELNFFDEKFSPFEFDDIDLCCRAFKKFGLLSGANPIFYYEINGSKKNNINSQNMSKICIQKNSKIIFKRHNDLAV